MALTFKKVQTEANEYILGKVIGNGGTSVIKSVKDKDNKEYAIKILIAGLEQADSPPQESLKRFQAEIEFQKKCNCPYIAPILDNGVIENGGKEYYFYIMPLYKSSFRDVLKEKKEPIVILKYFINICEALKFIHKKSIVHRDIKPENFLYDENKDILLLSDFGIAHFKESSITKKGKRLANFDYCSPEQKKGSHVEVTKESDIFSMGLLLNEIFTGQLPLGEKYKKIFEVNPLYFDFDSIVASMISADINERESNIQNIINKINYTVEQIEENLEFIAESLQVNSKIDLNQSIIEQAKSDIAMANKLMGSDFEKYELNYHCNIHYITERLLIDSIIVAEIYEIVLAKFVYESNILKSSKDIKSYQPINMEKEDDLKIYRNFEEIISSLNYYQNYDYLVKRARKYYISLCDYHAQEVNEAAKNVVDKIREDLKDVPVIYIAEKINKFFSLYGEIENFNFVDVLCVDVDKSANEKIFSDLYCDTERKQKEYFDSLQNKFDFSIKKNNKNYDIIFTDSNAKNLFYKSCEELKNRVDGIIKFDVDEILKKIKRAKKTINIDEYEIECILKKLISK